MEVASGIWPCMRIHPFNAPNVDITAPAPTRILAQLPPDGLGRIGEWSLTVYQYFRREIPMTLIVDKKINYGAE